MNWGILLFFRRATTSRPRKSWRKPSRTSKKNWKQRVKYFEENGKLIEAQRIAQRTRYDIEMLQEIGFCSGVENYSRVLSRRAPGSAPYTLIDYFPKDFLLIVDESHVTLPQVRAMYHGDRARKESLVENGFRLPSAYDNRPLNFDEFNDRLNQIVYVSATPAEYELSRSGQVSSRSSARPVCSIRRSLSVRLMARSTISLEKSTPAQPRANGFWSPRSPRKWPRI